MDRKVYLMGLVVLLGVSSFANFIGKESIGKHLEYLDVNGQYLVEWEAYLDTKTIVFELTAATTGFVGFGISPNGGMKDADIIIGGVHPNGTAYFGNYHATGNGLPDVDDNETWELIQAAENTTHTYLKIGREWNTCDSQDVAIDFSPVLDNPLALRHTHHFVIRMCTAPQGSTDEEFFEPFIDQAGEECFNGSPDVPLEHCESFLGLWAVGGKSVVYPDHAGFPLAVNGSISYFMLEYHLDNPNKLKGLTFETGVQMFYTPKLRQYDAGLFNIGSSTNYAITIPPKSEAHMVVGHCSPSCTSRIPETGINVFLVLLHSHLSGRKIKLRHYRDGIELPWVSSDDHYDFNFQQNRPLLKEVKILPGDHLITECTYSTMDGNRTVIGGLSTRHEMCNSPIAYYPDIGLDFCRSTLITTDLLKEFGIEGYEGSSFNPTITAPESMANKTYAEVLDTMIPWTEEFKSRVQNLMRYGDHAVVCGRGGFTNYTDIIKYNDTSKEYAPLNKCKNRENPDIPGGDNKQTVIQSSLYLMACMLAMVTLQLSM